MKNKWNYVIATVFGINALMCLGMGMILWAVISGVIAAVAWGDAESESPD